MLPAESIPVHTAEVLLQHRGIQAHRGHRDTLHPQRFQLRLCCARLGQNRVIFIDAQRPGLEQYVHQPSFRPIIQAVCRADVGYECRPVSFAPAVDVGQKKLLVAKAEQCLRLCIQRGDGHPTVGSQMPHRQIPHHQPRHHDDLFFLF